MKKIITIIALSFMLATTNAYAVRCIDAVGKITTGNPCPFNTTQVTEISDIEEVFTSIVTVSGILLILGFFVMMIMGGMKFLLSGGDPKAIQAAKGTITWAIAGLAFFALSFTILLLIEAFTGVQVRVFKLTGF